MTHTNNITIYLCQTCIFAFISSFTFLLMCGCLRLVFLTRVAMGKSAVCDCGVTWSYSCFELLSVFQPNAISLLRYAIQFMVSVPFYMLTWHLQVFMLVL